MGGPASLGRAFWKYAVLYGAIANLAATTAALSTLALGLPGGLALLVHLLPLPYVAATVVGVFRSSDHYAGPPRWARLAETAVVIWAALMVLV